MFQGFQFPKTILIWFEAHPGTAGWMQAIVASVAIVAVYYAATIPVRAEARYREQEKKLRADGMALLLLPDILVLKGEIETMIDSGDIHDPPVTVSSTLEGRADQLYLLGSAGGRLLQSIGMVNGVAAQTRRFQAREGSPVNALLVHTRHSVAANSIWRSNVDTLKLCIMNLDEVIEQFTREGTRKRLHKSRRILLPGDPFVFHFSRCSSLPSPPNRGDHGPCPPSPAALPKRPLLFHNPVLFLLGDGQCPSSPVTAQICG
jgi:hypothetical protein